MKWQDIQVIEDEGEQPSCSCCAPKLDRASGDLEMGSVDLGWYEVSLANMSASNPPIIQVFMGNWDDEAPKEARSSIRAVWRPDGFEFLNWDPHLAKVIDSFTPLGRDEVADTPMAAEIQARVEAIIHKDTRLQGIHQYVTQ